MITSNDPSIGIIGCGAIAEEFYLPHLVGDAGIQRNLHLIDPSSDRTRDLAKRFAIPSVATDYREVFGDLDGVIVAVPPHLHHPIVMDCLDAGLHVLCEKPLALNSEHVREMVKKADDVGRHLMVNLNRRLGGSFIGIRNLIQSQRLGRPRFIDYNIRENFSWPTVSGWYFGSKENTRGVLLDRGAHVFDTICWWLGGKPEITDAYTDSLGGPEAVTTVKFRYQDCEGKVVISILGKAKTGFSVAFDDGKVEAEEYDYTGYLETDSQGKSKRVNVDSGTKTPMDIGKLITDNFVAICRGNAEPIIPGRDAIASAEFIDEAYQRATSFDRPWYDQDPNFEFLRNLGGQVI